VKVDEWVEDLGSAFSYKRKGFNEVVEQIELGQVRRLIIASQDRFVRFGYDWFEAFCNRHGTDITVINGDSFSPEEELVRDLTAIITVFSARRIEAPTDETATTKGVAELCLHAFSYINWSRLRQFRLCRFNK
jgi:predicted site-specific integrase-resolvase